MSVLSWIILGLVAGALGKLIMPGDDPGGIIVTILLGIAGAFVGGFLGSQIGVGSTEGLDLTSIATATVGAIVLLFGYRQFRGRKA